MNFDNSFLEKQISKGIRLLESGNLIDAEKIFKKLSQNKNSEITGFLFLGIIQIKKNNNNLAKEFFEKILNIDTEHQDANLNLGLVFFNENNFKKADFYFNKVIKINKLNINAHYHKGLINLFTKKYDAAKIQFNICKDIDKNFFHAYMNLGHIYLREKNFNNAIVNYKKVIDIDQNNNNSKFNLSWCYFATSDLDRAFEYYEFRKEKTILREKTLKIKEKFQINEWFGEDLNKKKIIIIGEQGIGDNIQFFRYLFSLIKKYDVKIFFYTEEKLKFLFENSPFEIITNLENISAVHYYQHLLSLPGILYRNNKEIQERISFIEIDKKNNEKWKNKLKHFKKPIIALNWQGNKDYLFDDKRSIKLSNFENIIKINRYDFISLQKNYGHEQIKKNNFSKYITDLSKEIDNGQNAFEDTISILTNIEMLVTSDTAIAHLAGTLNVNTYLLLSYNPDWRWFIELKHKCFYPSIKIIQQDKMDDWESALEKLEVELR